MMRNSLSTPDLQPIAETDAEDGPSAESGGVLDSKKKATIVDVARVADVSIGTVSRYLNGQALRESNRDRIERAIEQLSFRRSGIARAMKGEGTNIIGFLVPSYDEFHAGLLESLARLFRTSGYMMLTYCHDDSDDLLEHAVDFFRGQHVDAMILAGSPDAAEAVRKLAEEGTPVVIYNNDVFGLYVDRIFVENRRAANHAVSHLLDLGHKKIGLIGGDPKDTTGKERQLGYEQALAERGIALREDYIHIGCWRAASGYDAAERLMALEEPPTAVFSANYRMTTGLLEWVREKRIQIPQDLSVVSFDDVELFRLYGEGITAIQQPIERIAENIVGCVLSRIRSPMVPATTSRTLQCNLILRGSTQPPQR